MNTAIDRLEQELEENKTAIADAKEQFEVLSAQIRDSAEQIRVATQQLRDAEGDQERIEKVADDLDKNSTVLEEAIASSRPFEESGNK